MPAKKAISVLPDRVPSEDAVCARRALSKKLSMKTLSANSRRIRELCLIVWVAPSRFLLNSFL